MTTKLSERVASWSVGESGIVQFRYSIDGKQFLFNLTPETQQDVLREIGRLAANERSSISWNDAAYLTSMIREVMEMMYPTQVENDDSSIYVGNDLYVVGWSILMMCCSATFCVALFVFFVWGQ